MPDRARRFAETARRRPARTAARRPARMVLDAANDNRRPPRWVGFAVALAALLAVAAGIVLAIR